MKFFAKISHFSRQIVKLIVKVCLVLSVGPTETQSHDPRPLPESFHATNPMMVLKLANELLLKIVFFEVTLLS